MKNIGRSYAKLIMKLTTTLQVSYENSRQVMSFGKPSVRGCYKLVEYFELK